MFWQQDERHFARQLSIPDTRNWISLKQREALNCLDWTWAHIAIQRSEQWKTISRKGLLSFSKRETFGYGNSGDGNTKTQGRLSSLA